MGWNANDKARLDKRFGNLQDQTQEAQVRANDLLVAAITLWDADDMAGFAQQMRRVTDEYAQITALYGQIVAECEEALADVPPTKR